MKIPPTIPAITIRYPSINNVYPPVFLRGGQDLVDEDNNVDFEDPAVDLADKANKADVTELESAELQVFVVPAPQGCH